MRMGSVAWRIARKKMEDARQYKYVVAMPTDNKYYLVARVGDHRRTKHMLAASPARGNDTDVPP
jgi:hypothetical protein